MTNAVTLWGARTDFTVGQCILKPKQLLKAAAEAGYTHVAIADEMSVTAVIDATQQSKKLGVEVIPGCELRVTHWDKPEIVFGPKVYCKSEEAFVRLMSALSEAEAVNKSSILAWPVFVAMLREADYLVTTGDVRSAFSSAFPSSDVRELVERLRDAHSATQSETQVVLEYVGASNPFFKRVNANVAAFADESGLPTIISCMALYEKPEHADALDVMQAISRNMKLSSEALSRAAGNDYSLKTPSTLASSVGIPGAGAGDDLLVADLPWRWSKMPICLPKMASDEFAELVRLCKDAWPSRIGSKVMGFQPAPADIPVYVERLKMELKVLRELGFCNYFLLVSDLVNHAKSQKILVGPGRGSVGGSLIAFLLGITDVDPIRFNLLFERFINPERLDLPDADLDFMSARRHEVIEYLVNKYGRENVANISNYNTLGAPSAIGEVGKAMEIPDRDMAFKSYLPKEHGQQVPLEECEGRVPELQTYMGTYPEAYEISKILEGTLRSLGTHAAGVVVSSTPLKTRAVVQSRGVDLAVNWDKRVVEEQGLVKIDILGLTNLDVIARALAKIEHDYGKRIDTLDIPLDDPQVMAAFGRGETQGVFQFESGGMRKLLKDLRKGGELTFEDLSAATALFRPGPIDAGLMDDYVSIRQGVTAEGYDHPSMEAALKPTFGVVVYQEQVMQLARDLAGFTLAGADHLRKAMGKKDKEKMAAERDKWVQGCKAHSGIEEAWSNALFDKIEMFAGYAFNRSHSVEYTIISVWTMWLKQHYPHAFYAAALEVFNEDKLIGLVHDAAKRGIDVLPPDINDSTSEFRRLGDNLLAPLNRIKGIGEPTEQAILAARAAVGGEFTSVDQLIDNVEKRKCNIRHRAILEEVGAFANIIPGSLPARHPDRVKRQLELLPGLIAQNVRAERNIVIDDHVKGELTALYTELRDNGSIVLPRFGKKPRVMIVIEAPTFHDEKAGKLMETDMAVYIKDALKANGLSMQDVYVTTYLKKPKGGKQASSAEIQFSKPYFAREVEILKPAVILALGSFVVRELLPDERGGIIDLNGKVVYDKTLDASIVCAISAGQVWHDNTKQTLLNDAFARAWELYS